MKFTPKYGWPPYKHEPGFPIGGYIDCAIVAGMFFLAVGALLEIFGLLL